MKKFSLLLFAFGASLLAQAQDATTPQAGTVTASEITLTPGGEAGFFTVNLVGGTKYTAYNMDIFLPEGFELAYDGVDSEGNKIPMIYMAADNASIDGKDIYPFTKTSGPFGKKTYTHMLSSSTPSHQQIRIACLSTESKEFTATSGALFHVYVKASPYAKPGANNVRMEGIALVKKDASQDIPENCNYTINASNNSSVEINVTADNKFSTYILPFDSEAPANTQIYSCKEVDEANQWVKLTEETSIKAYTPYILYAENGCTTTLSGTVNEAQYVTSASNGLLTGVVTMTELKDGYVLQNKGEGAKFYKANPDAPFSLRAGRCYLNLPATATANAYSLDMTPTGITAIYQENEASKVIYDLQGRRVYYPSSKHIYIVNGEKVLMK